MDRNIKYMNRENLIKTYGFGGYTFKEMAKLLKEFPEFKNVIAVYKDAECKHCDNGTIEVVDKSGTTKLIKLTEK